MEENTRKGRVGENKVKKKKSKTSIVQIIIILLLIVFVIGGTVVLTLYKFKELDNKYAYKEEVSVFESEDKKVDEDLKYALKEGDVYGNNDIHYTYYVYSNGSYVESSHFYESGYIQIDGLKNKDVQEKINGKLRDIEYEGRAQGLELRQNIVGNFSNILSVYVYEKNSYGSIANCINVNLIDGEEIKFEDLFVKSAPVVSMLYDAYCQNAAWDIDYDKVEQHEGDSWWEKAREEMDMDNRDTSEYEDYLYYISDWYKQSKGNIVYTVSPFEIKVYGMIPEREKSMSKEYVSIPMYRYRDYIAIYKRYETSEDLYEENFYIKNIPALYMNLNWQGFYDYELVEKNDNLFINGVFSVKNDNIMNLYNNEVQKYREMAAQDKDYGYLIQANISSYNRDAGYNYNIDANAIAYNNVSIDIIAVKVPIKQYRDEFSKMVGKIACEPSADISARSFYRLVEEDDRCICVSKGYGEYSEYSTHDCTNYYFDINWNYLGEDISVIKAN